MRALVTGGNGFLGGAIVSKLLEQGHQVRSIARRASPDLQKKGVEVVQGDIADLRATEKAVSECDVVFHVAAKAGVWGSWQEYYRSNVVGTENIINACRRSNVPKLVYTSSPSVVFGGSDLCGVDESIDYPTKYIAYYPETKAMAERAVIAANDKHLSTVSLRPHLIWGPGDQHLVPRIVERAAKKKLRIVGTGDYLVDSTYIDNAADAHILAAESLTPNAPHAGKSYFISNGEPMNVGELINKIVASAGLPPVTKHIPKRVAYVAGAISEVVYRALRINKEPLMTRFVAEQLATAHYFDISGAKRDFGYSPKISIEEGLVRLGRALRST